MKKILQAYLGKTIGINFERAFKIEAAELSAVEDSYFSIVDGNKGYTHSFPYYGIVQIIENPSGIEIGGLFTHKEKFPVVVKVGHLVEYLPA